MTGDAQKRTLTKRETMRLEEFEKKKVELGSEGYTYHPLTFSIEKATGRMFTITLPIAVLLLMAFILRVYFANQNLSFRGSLLAIPIFILAIVLHELIHGIFWGMSSKKGFKSIEFGVMWKYLTPYCTCTEPLSKMQYIVGAAMPTLLLGVIPTILSIVLLQLPLFILGQIMIFAGGGDMLIIESLMKYQEKGRETIYLDHPTELGLAVFER